MTDTSPSPRRQTEADRLLEEITRAGLKEKKSERRASVRAPRPRPESKRESKHKAKPRCPRTTPRWVTALWQALSSPVVKRYYLPLLLVALLLGVVIAVSEPGSAITPKESTASTGAYAVKPLERPYRYIGSFRRDFDDLNPIQLEAAQAIGITPARTREELLERKGLVRLTESPYLKIDRLTHSEPLLVPEAAELVREIAAAFHRQLEVDDQPLYRLVVTSVTRTAEDMKDLRQRNGNASPNSTHCYGTTLDISWQRYDKVDPTDPRTIEPEELKHLFARVLRDFHQAGRCYIKHERRQACFHITARPRR